MKTSSSHLSDEPMRMYEWSGAAAATRPATAAAARRRSVPWNASYAVLAALTGLLILSGCDNQDTADQASERIEQRMGEQPRYDTTAPPADEAAGPASDELGGTTGRMPSDEPGQTGAPVDPGMGGGTTGSGQSGESVTPPNQETVQP